MLKRTAAIFFILVVAGQAWAGVCGCLKSEVQAGHSCCKKKSKSETPSISPKGCCDQHCFWTATETNPRSQSDKAATDLGTKIKAEPIDRAVWAFRSVSVVPPAPSPPFLNHRLRYSRPPDDLYLRNHSFLI